MCLAIPGKILDTEEIGGLRIGRIQFGGVTRKAYLDYVPDAVPGDYVMVHVGFAISKVDEAEAARTFELMEQMGLLQEELGQERGLPGLEVPKRGEPASGGT
jgi:hydrogenase expression/formation protein HypC